MAVTQTDCRTDDGITVGLIDSIIFISRVLSTRNFDSPPVREALLDLLSDRDLQAILKFAQQNVQSDESHALSDAQVSE